MTGYTDIFGGSAIEPSDVAFNLLTGYASPLQLQWPNLATIGDATAARILEIETSGTITLPDARLASTGQDFLFRNTSGGTVQVNTFEGASLLTLDAGEVFGDTKYAYLNDNTSANGTWAVITFGSGVTTVDASQLVGFGLTVIGSTLNAANPVSNVSTSFTIQLTDRSRLYNFTGGAQTLSLLTASAYGDDFFFSLANNGSGAVTIDPAGANTIDGSATIDINPGESAFVMTDGSNWFTVGRGRSVSFNFTQLVKNVAGSADVTLTTTEAGNKVLKFIGLLTGDINVIVPNVVSLYIIDNETTGAFTLTVKTAAGTGIEVPQNNRNILYSDGTNVLAAVTVSVASTTFSDGSAAAPSITFGSDTDTGIYRVGTNSLGITAGGVLRFTVSDTSVTFSGPLTVSDADLILQDSADATKQLKFDLSGITTGTTRTFTVPDIDDTLVTLSATQTLTNKTLTSPVITILDSNLVIQDNADATKQLQIQLSGISAGTTRTLAAPDASDTLVVLSLAQTLLNKTLASPTITSPTITTPTLVVPSFSVNRNGVNQDFAAVGSYTKILFTVEDFDTNNDFNVGTSVFQPTIAGKYLVTLSCALVSIFDGKLTAAAIFKNGSLYTQAFNVNGATLSSSAFVAAVIDMNGTTDTIEGTIFNGDASQQSIIGSSTETRMTGVWVSS